jgi:LPS-assembly protein
MPDAAAPVVNSAVAVAPGAEPASDPAPALKAAETLSRAAGLDPAADLPVLFEADQLEGLTGETLTAKGAVKLKRGDLSMRADEITHTRASNEATAHGHVRISRGGDVFSGPAIKLKLDTLEGEFLQPVYRFARTGAGGKAQKVEFLGPNKFRASGASYTSCTPENTADRPDWELITDSVELDFDANEGRARNAVIRFMGVPILGAPMLTFPVTEARKSGFLPPSFDIDNKSGFEFAQPYYWNIAPNRDATLVPTLSSRRGLGMSVETRYLYDKDQGVWQFSALPNDRLAQRNRGMMDVAHQGEMGRASGWSSALSSTQYDLRWRRASDDDYWRDFPRGLPSLTPRLMGSHAAIERQINTRAWGLGPSQTTLYARVQTWQALQDRSTSATPDTQIISPYRREPQVGLRSRSSSPTGWTWRMEGEFNRFTHEDSARVKGNRLHANVEVERALAPRGAMAWHLTPKLSLNAVTYNLDRNNPATGPQGSLSRVIPTLSVDGGTVFERPVNWFGQSLVQTLEPRVQYVYTPYKKQSDLPVFDSTERDFNQYSIYSENAFTGVDRVSDANWVNLGVTSRVIDPATGAETMRLGIVQKVQFSDRRITPNDGPAITQSLSDLLLLGSTKVIPNWSVDTTVQYNAQDSRVTRSLLGVRYSPGDWRTVNVNYRFNRGSSEQVDLGWQWPLFNGSPKGSQHSAGGASCRGTWYSVGRLSYSLKDRRMSDALVGFEYDGGCWITRVVAERVSTGRADASTRLMLQLELVGLSRLGTSPLRSLKDNIPGYRLLRDESSLIRTPSPEPDLNDD